MTLEELADVAETIRLANDDDAENSYYCAESVVESIAPKLLAEVRRLRAVIADGADARRLGELHAKRWLWLDQVIRESPNAEEFSFAEEDEMSVLRRKITSHG